MKRASDAEGAAGIQVIGKCFAALEALGSAGQPVALAVVARAAGLPKPTTYRILQSLITLGYVAQEPETGNYHTTYKLAQLGRDGRYTDIQRLCLPAMEKLHDKFNETVNLAVLEGSRVRYLHAIETTRPLRWKVSPNANDPFYCTAVGKAMVAHLPLPEQQALLGGITIRALTPNTVRGRAELQDLLTEARARGWAVDDEEAEVGVNCVGVPVLDSGYPVAGISVSMPKSRWTPERAEQIAAALLRARPNTSGRKRGEAAA